MGTSSCGFSPWLMEVPQLSKQDPGSLHQQEGLMRTSHWDGEVRSCQPRVAALFLKGTKARCSAHCGFTQYDKKGRKKKKKHIAPMEAFTEAES